MDSDEQLALYPEVPELAAPEPAAPKPVDFSKAVLTFEATLAEPDIAAHFLGTGGGLECAAAPWTTNFAVSGSKFNKKVQLFPYDPVSVEIPLGVDGGLANIDKLTIENQRQGCAINGTIGSFYAGAAAVYLRDLLNDKMAGRPTSVPLTYCGRASDGVVTLFNVQVLGVPNDKLTDMLEQRKVDMEKRRRAMDTLKRVLNESWVLRTMVLISRRPDGAPDEALAKLTKCFTRTNVGTNAECYLPVHDNLNVRFPFPLESLEDLFKFTLKSQHGPSGVAREKRAYEFLRKNSQVPNMEATIDHSPHVVAAISQIVNYLMPYKSDGYAYLAPNKAMFMCAESWIRRFATPIHMNDCENAAKLAISMLETIKYDERIMQTDDFPNLKCVHNLLVPYYTWGLSIVGAGGAEASSGQNLDDGCGSKPLNGHAIAMLIPTMQLLSALDAANHALYQPLDKNEKTLKMFGGSDEKADWARLERFNALYPPEVYKKLPAREHKFYEKAMHLRDRDDPSDPDSQCLQTGGAAAEALDPTKRRKSCGPYITKDKLNEMQVFAIEGTTPAFGQLCGAGGGFADVAQVAEGVRLDSCVEANVGPTLGRAMKVLALGPVRNRFYQVICEFHLPSSHPLYRHAELRSKNLAVSQFLFSPLTRHTGNFLRAQKNAVLVGTGVQVYELAQEEKTYHMVPMAVYRSTDFPDLDYAADLAIRDEMPRDERTETGDAFAINEYNARIYHKNLKALWELGEYYGQRTRKENPNWHTVVYLLPLAALVGNPHGVAEFCNRLKNQKATKVGHVNVNMSEDGNIRRLMQPTLDKESRKMQGAKFVRVVVHAFAE